MYHNNKKVMAVSVDAIPGDFVIMPTEFYDNSIAVVCRRRHEGNGVCTLVGCAIVNDAERLRSCIGDTSYGFFDPSRISVNLHARDFLVLSCLQARTAPLDRNPFPDHRNSFVRVENIDHSILN